MKWIQFVFLEYDDVDEVDACAAALSSNLSECSGVGSFDERSVVRELFDNDRTTVWPATQTDVGLIWYGYRKRLTFAVEGLSHLSPLSLCEV